jgi:hypothetical protein
MIEPFKGGTYRSLVHHTHLHYITLKYQDKTLWKQPFLCALKTEKTFIAILHSTASACLEFPSHIGQKGEQVYIRG